MSTCVGEEGRQQGSPLVRKTRLGPTRHLHLFYQILCMAKMHGWYSVGPHGSLNIALKLFPLKPLGPNHSEYKKELHLLSIFHGVMKS